MNQQEKLGAELPAGVKVCSLLRLCEIRQLDTKGEDFKDHVINEVFECLTKVHHGMEIELPRDYTISVWFGPTGSMVANPLTWYVVDECLSSVNL